MVVNFPQLNKNATSLEFDKVLIALSTCAATELGKKRCLNATIFQGKEKIEYEILLTTQARKILDDTGAQSFSALNFIANCKEILTAHKLGAQDIFDCAKTLHCARRVKNFLSKLPNGLEITDFSQILYTNIELEEKIFNTFDNSLNVVENATDKLKSLYNSKRDSEINLKNKINQMLSNPNFTNCLQDNLCTKRADRTVFQVIASHKNKVSGLVHDVSSSGQTFFIEPKELVPLNNKIKQLESEITAEIERILLNLSKNLHEIDTELIRTEHSLIELDFIFAKAKYSIITNSSAPVLVNNKIIKIQKMRHPLLIGMVENLIENDFEIGENFNSLVITGSNTGGKTVVIKSVGLLSAMAFAGLHTPALDFKLYPFDAIYADISEEQSLSQSLSTFSAHIKNVANIIENATSESLILFDELGAGTDPSEGAALARAILEYFSNKGAITLTTTHLGELKLLEYSNSKFKNASVEFNPQTLKPTYRLIIGVAGSSNALLISKNLNLKNEIIENAKNILNSTNNPTIKMFEEIQLTHQNLTKLEMEANKKEKSAHEVNLELEEKLREIKTNKKKTIDNFKRKYQASLESARNEIKETLLELRAEKSEKIARRSYARLAKLENMAREEFLSEEEKLANKYQPLLKEEIKIGKNALIKGLEQVVTILSLPDKKNMVEVQIGLIKSKVKLEKLAHTDKKPNKQLKKVSIEFNSDFSPTQNLLRLDLRGLRVDEALDILEKHLDLASLKNIAETTIIHGHGTGALKGAIRDYLKVSPYVSKFRTGELQGGEGGDGVSIVNLK